MVQLTVASTTALQEEFMLQPESLEELFFAALGDAEMFGELLELCKRRDIDAVPYINRAEARYAQFLKKLYGPQLCVSGRKTRIPLQITRSTGNPL